jgi:hypothetical protein
MGRVEDYRAFAKQYFVWAQEAESEELRRASLEMASYWMEAATRTESFGDSQVEPKRSGSRLPTDRRRLDREEVGGTAPLTKR